MDKKDIIISTVPVTIKVIEVGGKKMTKAVFDQIMHGDLIWLYKTLGFIEEVDKYVLGFVMLPSGGKFIVFAAEGCLFKFRIGDIAYPEAQESRLNNRREYFKKLPHVSIEDIDSLEKQTKDLEDKKFTFEANSKLKERYTTPQTQIFIAI